jgi:integrase
MAKKVAKSRRNWGSGSLFKKQGSQTWTMQYYRHGPKMRGGKPVFDGNGKPVYARIRVRESTGESSQRKAQELLTERLNQVKKGTWFEQERRPPTLMELFDSLRDHYLINGRTGTAKSLEWRRGHLEPVFVGVLAANLTTDAITRYIRKRREEGAASATINRELAAVRGAMRFGQRSTPPKVRTVPHIPMLRENNVRLGFVEHIEYQTLTAQPMELWLRTLLELAYTYGWRKGELLGLRVRQIQLAQRSIRLDPGTTKNGEGREVSMTDKLEELLGACIEGKKPEDFVLTRQGNRPVKEFKKAWWNLCIGAGLGKFVCRECGGPWTGEECAECGSLRRKYRGLIVHDLRRSAAKALRRAGVAESVIMATGGWKTAAMFRRYAIVSNEDQRAAMAALERARQENSPYSAPISAKQPPVGAEPVN